MGDHLPEYGKAPRAVGICDLRDLKDDLRALQTFISTLFSSLLVRGKAVLSPCMFVCVF